MENGVTNGETHALRRITDARQIILDNLSRCQSGDILSVESDAKRLLRRLMARFGLSGAAAKALVQQAQDPDDGREALQGDTFDLVSVSFLERGAQVARSVGRIATLDGQALGTGFHVGAGVIMTNNHVIPSKVAAAGMVIEFDFEHDLIGQLRPVTRFRLDPAIFMTSPEDVLDYTLVSIGPRQSGTGRIEDFGMTGLSDADDKHIIGEYANIVQHPRGRPKEVSVQENRLVHRLDNTLYYVADTEKGSSGAPVYNNQWQVIALHHWGAPFLDRPDGGRQDINEGVRISRIVADIKAQLSAEEAEAASVIETMLELGHDSWQSPNAVMRPDAPAASMTLHGGSAGSDGGLVIPISGSLRLDGVTAGAVAHHEDTAPPGDDLTRIKGVGPALAERLHARGITTFAQIGRWPRSQAERMDRLLDARGSVLRDKWRDQARKLDR